MRPALAFLVPLLAVLWATFSAADPVRYLLEKDKSIVGFTYVFGTSPAKGTMPVAAADLSVDFDDLSRSRIDITVAADGARTGFVLATDALKSASVLDTARFPHIRFKSTSVRRKGAGASITGALTIRGVTRALTLDARIYRQRATAAGDRRSLSILLTGTVDRRTFGATGYADLVGSMVGLRILARIVEAGPRDH
ncbi:MAG: YceI family protein [Pseudomonadota bacterium]